jgi:hypothetical protein
MNIDKLMMWIGRVIMPLAALGHVLLAAACVAGLTGYVPRPNPKWELVFGAFIWGGAAVGLVYLTFLSWWRWKS